LYNIFIQNLLTSLPKGLIVKIAFVIIRRSQKPQFPKNKHKYFQKQTQQKIKDSDSSMTLFISQGHDITEFGVFLLPRIFICRLPVTTG